MSDTVVLHLVGSEGEEDIEISTELWGEFEQRAKELNTPVEELFVIALDHFLKSEGY